MILTNTFISIIIAFLAILFAYFRWSFQYWKKRNVPYFQPLTPLGNVADALLGKENLGVTIKKIYLRMKKKGWKHGGIYTFTSPSYIPIDTEYLKNVTIKDFEYFTDRTVAHNEKEDPLEEHLPNLQGIKWRNMRTKLTPTFTSGKMKTMFHTMAECRFHLLKKMDKACEEKKPIDIKDILERFTIDIIGCCAFGLECKTFEDEKCPFAVYGRRIFFVSKYQHFKRNLCKQFPRLGSYLNFYMTPKDITDFFLNLVDNTTNYRETNNLARNDLLQLLIEVKNKENLTVDEVAAQCFVFFLAGFETSSATMTFALYELSKHQEIQQKARNEIVKVLEKYDGQITYEALQDMKYLGQVIDETLRMYPPLPVVNRTCTKDYKIPNEDVIIRKGTEVMIPILGVHYDEEYYHEPEKFDPERFSEKSKISLQKDAYIPFGIGPRHCIARRFGMMQVKIGLSCLLENYKFTDVDPKTQEPFKMEPCTNVLSVIGAIWLNAQKLEKNEKNNFSNGQLRNKLGS